jgi:alcohol dehydrogenase class IV
MADQACADGNLGLAHCLAGPLETLLDMEHGLAVGVLMPRVIRFNAPVAGAMMSRLAAALGVETSSGNPEQDAIQIEKGVFELYREIGFPKFFDAHFFDPGLIPEMAMAAGKGIDGEGYLETPPTRQTLIPSRNRRRATILEAEELFEQCFA